MVWSNEEISLLAREFVPVAMECYYLYPHDEAGQRARAKDPVFQTVSRFAKQAPREAWENTPNASRQGIYLMGPKGEFLGGRPGFVEAPTILDQMQRAFERWKSLKGVSGYANQLVPQRGLQPPAGVSGNLILKGAVRDIARWKGDKRGERLEEIRLPNPQSDMRRWAWNGVWVGFSQPEGFVTETSGLVPDALVRKLAKTTLIDAVHNQTSPWDDTQVKSARLEVKRVSALGDRVTLAYRGEIDLRSSLARYQPKLYGEAVWNRSRKRFESFDLVAIGPREGGSPLIRLADDQGPSPMGVALKLYP